MVCDFLGRKKKEQIGKLEFERMVSHEEKCFIIANTCSCNSRVFSECLDYGSDNRYGRILPTSSVHNSFLDLFGQTVCTQMENNSCRIDCSYSGGGAHYWSTFGSSCWKQMKQGTQHWPFFRKCFPPQLLYIYLEELQGWWKANRIMRAEPRWLPCK